MFMVEKRRWTRGADGDTCSRSEYSNATEDGSCIQTLPNVAILFYIAMWTHCCRPSWLSSGGVPKEEASAVAFTHTMYCRLLPMYCHVLTMRMPRGLVGLIYLVMGWQKEEAPADAPAEAPPAEAPKFEVRVPSYLNVPCPILDFFPFFPPDM
jgi:hypothetical protein